LNTVHERTTKGLTTLSSALADQTVSLDKGVKMKTSFLR